jgi:hypothetical protein
VEGNVESLAEIEVLKWRLREYVSYVNGRRRRRMREEHEFPIYWP